MAQPSCRIKLQSLQPSHLSKLVGSSLPATFVTRHIYSHKNEPKNREAGLSPSQPSPMAMGLPEVTPWALPEPLSFSQRENMHRISVLFFFFNPEINPNQSQLTNCLSSHPCRGMAHLLLQHELLLPGTLRCVTSKPLAE